MKIAVMGTGSVGQALAGKLMQLGHQVVIGTRNPEESLARTEPDGWGNPAIGTWMKIHPEARLVTYAEAAAFSEEVIMHAMNGRAALASLEMAGAQNLAGKILIDITNPLDFSAGFPPSLFVCNTDSLGEQIQAAFPELKVVKSLNTMANAIMVNPSLVAGNHNVFVNGNDEMAKNKVIGLLKSFGWKETQILDLGDITASRGVEMLLPFWVRTYARFKTGNFNYHINFG
jgi:predicted dinucleotide-binding enzyme